MKNIILNVFLLLSLLTHLTACTGPDTPQEVAHSFWQAVIENDSDDAVKYSTLTDSSYYDGFSKDWQGYQFAIGKVVIEENQASIKSSLTSPANSGLENRSFITYLVKQQDEWKVDYERTKHSITGGSIGSLFNSLSKLGENLNKNLEKTVKHLNKELQGMLHELEDMSRSFGEQAGKTLEQHAEKMREHIKALEESINRALEEEDENLSDDDKNSLRVMAKELNQDREQLADHSMESVISSSKHVVNAQLKLESYSNKELKKYKAEWQALSQQFENDLRQMMQALSSK